MDWSEIMSVLSIIISVAGIIIAITALRYSMRSDNWARLTEEERYVVHLRNGQVKLGFSLRLCDVKLPRDGGYAYPLMLENNGPKPEYSLRLGVSTSPKLRHISFLPSNLRLERISGTSGANKEFVLETLENKAIIAHIEMNLDYPVDSISGKECLTSLLSGLL